MTSKPFASTATHHQLTFQSQISGTLNLSTLFQVDLQRANSLKLPTAQRSEKLWKNDTNHASIPRNEFEVLAVAEIWQNWQAGRFWAAGLPQRGALPGAQGRHGGPRDLEAEQTEPKGPGAAAASPEPQQSALEAGL